jgi:hypothetical protein
MKAMSEFSSLNIESFNSILFKAIPADRRIDLLEHEIGIAYGIKIQAMEAVVDCLNKGLPYKDKLEEVNNINSNCDRLQEMLEEQRRAGL